MIKNNKGFTLVEFLVVAAILGILIVMLILRINPIAQIEKAQDATIKHELEQIQNALTVYYNDNNCYPSSIPFGSSWSNNGALYMQKVPENRNCNETTGEFCYLFQTDESSACPQWGVVYAKLKNESSCEVEAACGVSFEEYNYCSTTGNIDCDYILANPPE